MPWWWRRANWLYEAIASGELPDWEGQAEKRRLPVTVSSLGTLTFEAGELVVADPYLMAGDVHPVKQRLRDSPYEVSIVRATVGPEHDRNAAAIFVDGGQSVVTDWDMARWPDQDVGALEHAAFFGYGVDAGTGCFADRTAANVAGDVLAADAGMLEDPLSRALFADPKLPGAAVVAPGDRARPIAVFTSGWGDGTYPTWLGLDERGDVVVVLTDFMLTGDPYDDLPDDSAQPSPPAPPTTSHSDAPAKTSRWRKLFGRD